MCVHIDVDSLYGRPKYPQSTKNIMLSGQVSQMSAEPINPFEQTESDTLP